MTKLTWEDILADTTLNNLTKRINRRYLYMGEADLLYLVNEFENAHRMRTGKQ